MKLYLASPFFNEEELEQVRWAEQLLRGRGFSVFSPREHEVRGQDPFTSAWSRETFQSDRDAIDRADAVVLLYHGAYSDSGTAWECGYAYAKGKPVVVVHFSGKSNLMIHEGCRANLFPDDLKDYDFEAMPGSAWTGDMT